MGTVASDGLMAGGVLPVMKHIPGHGRAGADSHLELPVVDASLGMLEATDFAAFRSLAHLPAAMTAHVVYPAIDASAPASTSALVTRRIIREYIGFDGLLMSDDLGMRALSGGFGDRARAVIGAGSDLALHCSGNLSEMREVAGATPLLAGRARDRYLRAVSIAEAEPVDFDVEAARTAVARLLARVA
ncbi:MAG: glycoside hydrolase family 3 N-terminal domain-containing protein [Hyphomicrobiaceae bacterium]